MLRLALILSLLLTGCVDIHRGAIVQMTIKRLDDSTTGQHYAFFATINGGAVLLERFKVLDSRDDCGDTLNTQVQLVHRWNEGMSAEEQCDHHRRFGTIDLLQLSTVTLVGGMRIDTQVDLSEATNVFLTIEDDEDFDPRPSTAILAADLGDGIAPQVAAGIACRQTLCTSLDQDNPDDLSLFESVCGANIPVAPRKRRGVRLGWWLKAPAPDGCVDIGAELGEIAIVPARDDTAI